MFVVCPLCRRELAESGIIFIFSGNETLDGKKSTFEHSNMTVSSKSEIKLEVNRQLLGRLSILLLPENLILLLQLLHQLVTESRQLTFTLTF